GAGALDHLEAVTFELDRSYNWRPASELFPSPASTGSGSNSSSTARTPWPKPASCTSRAAHLSYLLSDLAHDLASHLIAEAYAIDSYAESAGHDEACAWASSSLSCYAVYVGQPGKAATAAHRGLNKAPRNSPIAARLHARTARAYALQGNQPACTD